MKLDHEEKELMDTLERGEWHPVGNFEQQRKELIKTAKMTMQKDQRMNIRVSKRDIDALKVRALEEGLPYQTLVSSILHKYLTGRLTERHG